LFIGIGAVLFITPFAAAFYGSTVCPSEEMIIRSESDALRVAKLWVQRDRFFNMVAPRDVQIFLSAIDQTPNCCWAIPFRTFFLAPAWDISLSGKTDEGDHQVLMQLGRCGFILPESKFSMTDPPRRTPTPLRSP
jgi:hypothetical protein